MSELLKLAERCEQATGPDRELDAEIGATMQRMRVAAKGGDGSAIRIDETDPGHILESMGCGWWAPNYTASLDAAMTLVPEGWLLSTLNERNASGEHNWRWRAELWNAAAARRIGDDAPFVRGIARRAHANKAAPALALCAAALRALAAQEPSS